MKYYTIYYRVLVKNRLNKWICDYPYFHSKYNSIKRANKEIKKLKKQEHIRNLCMFEENTKNYIRYIVLADKDAISELNPNI